MVEFSGWEMPQHYDSIKAEHRAVRSQAGLFDVSHMGRFLVEGIGAGDFLQQMLTNDLAHIQEGQAQYTLLCNPEGGIIDDLIVYRGAPWRLVVNAANRERDLTWLQDRAPRLVKVTDVSQATSLLALQGPGAVCLEPLLHSPLQTLAPFCWLETEVASVPVLASRTGYTGEDGFELFAPSSRAAELWQALLAAGAIPCGLGARDVCRLEAGLRLHGMDMNETTDPYQVGLGWMVKLEKGPFTGHQALARIHTEGANRSLVGVQCTQPGIPRHGARLHAADESDRVLGLVTSGTFSFSLDRGIGLASIITGSASQGETVSLEVRGGSSRIEASIVPLPFYQRARRPAA
jgi:aminomethyltransferase